MFYVNQCLIFIRIKREQNIKILFELEFEFEILLNLEMQAKASIYIKNIDAFRTNYYLASLLECSGMGSERSRRSHRRSRDFDSSDDSEYEQERDRKKKKKKITEDDINDYLAKKAQKKAMKVAKKLKSQSVSGYVNESNPFGDSNLNEKFVWRATKTKI